MYRSSALACLCCGLLCLSQGCDRRQSQATPASQPVSVTPASQPGSREAGSRPHRPPGTRPAMPQEPQAASADFLQRTDPGCLRIMSWNIRWDSIFPDARDSRTEAFGRVLRAIGPDLVGLQEIKQHDAAKTAELFNELYPLPDGKLWHVYRGTQGAIVSRFPFRFTADDAPHPTHRNPAVAWIDLPDEQFPADLLMINNHFKCCDPEKNDPMRQVQADANLFWLRDAQTPGGRFDLPANSGIIIVGDFNLVGSSAPLDNLIAGNVVNEQQWGEDFKPDWDQTSLTAAHPQHNRIGPNYTWRDDSGPFPPRRLDFMIYSDSVLTECQSFVLNSASLSGAALEQAKLEASDTATDLQELEFDHLPLVLDVRFGSLENPDRVDGAP